MGSTIGPPRDYVPIHWRHVLSGAPLSPILAPGDLLIWGSRTTHCSAPCAPGGRGRLARAAALVCFVPRAFASEETLRRRRPATRSQTAATAAQPEEGDQCRICFSGAEDGKLISPCKCDGTQKYVHEDCLRKWQRTCAGTRKAKYCGVCRARFDLAPPAEPGRRPGAAAALLRLDGDRRAPRERAGALAGRWRVDGGRG